MEFITSLILLSVLVMPPMMLAGKEAMEMLFSGKVEKKPGMNCNVNDSGASLAGHEKTDVYDGMITVEIPVLEPQVVAYEPVLPPGEEYQIEIIGPSDRVYST